MGLEEVLKGIDEKVTQEINRIKREAEEEKNKIIERAKKEAQERKERIIEEAKREIEENRRRELIRVRREEKKNTLSLKAELMDQAFREAKDKFLNLDKKEYLSLVKDVLVANIKRGYEEILMSPQDKELVSKDFIKEVEKAVSIKGQKPNLKFSFDLDEKDRGFIIKGENMLINATISTLFSAIRDTEEIEVAMRLFG